MQAEALDLEFENHDDIFAIIRMQEERNSSGFQRFYEKIEE